MVYLLQKTEKAVAAAMFAAITAVVAACLLMPSSAWATDMADGTYVANGTGYTTNMLTTDVSDFPNYVVVKNGSARFVVQSYAPNKFDAVWKGMRDDAPEDPATADVIAGEFIPDEDGAYAASGSYGSNVITSQGVSYKAVRFTIPLTDDEVEAGKVYFVLRRSPWSPSNPGKWMGTGTHYYDFGTSLSKVSDSTELFGPDDGEPTSQDRLISLVVTSEVSTVQVASPAMTVVHGEPGDADFSVMVDLKMNDAMYDKVVYPSVIDGVVADAVAQLDGSNVFELSLINQEGATAFSDARPIVMRFHRADADAWIERLVTIDMQEGTVTIEGAPVNVGIVKALIAAIPSDPFDVKSDEAESVSAAQQAYALLDGDGQALLDRVDVEKDGKLIHRTYGRYLEQAIWAIDSLAPIDDSTTLANGTYTNKVASKWGMGKSTSARSKVFKVLSVTVTDGHATALVEHDSDTSDYIQVGGAIYRNQNPDGKSRYEVPIDLNSTFHFIVQGKGATEETEGIAHEMTTMVDESAVQPDDAGEQGDQEKPGDEQGQEGSDGSGESSEGMSLDEVAKLVDGMKDWAREQADASAAKVVKDAIAQLPKARAVTASDRSAIEALREAYDGLSDDQKALVDNVSKLEAAEAALSVIPADDGKKDDASKDSAKTDDGKNSSDAAVPAGNTNTPGGNAGGNAGGNVGGNAAQNQGAANNAASTGRTTSTNLAFNAPTAATAADSSASKTGTGVAAPTANATGVATPGAGTVAPAASGNGVAATAAPEGVAKAVDWISQNLMWIVIVGLLALVVGGAIAFSAGYAKKNKLRM